MYHNLFCIPSVIHTSCYPLDYIHYRSSLSSNERLQQTIEQIDSIRRIMSHDDHILLLEGSCLSDEEKHQLERDNVTIISFYEDERAFFLCHQHVNKSCYEVYVLKWAMEHYTCRYFYKFGGRYKLRDDFQLCFFQKEKPVFKTIQSPFIQNQILLECIFYAIPESFQETYLTIFSDLRIDTELYDKAVENCFYERIKDQDYIPIDTLGIEGYDAIFKVFHKY